VHPGLCGRLLSRREEAWNDAPAVRIRRRCDTYTNFDYNQSHLTPSQAPISQFEGNQFGGGAERTLPERR
jgi:hypothetical protein